MNGSGLVIVDKPAGLTSHDVVGRLRRMLGTRRIGHAGTLDPMATGVLVLGVRRAPSCSATWRGRQGLHRHDPARRGDRHRRRRGRDRRPLRTHPQWTRRRSRAAMAALTGTIPQVPSAVSAIKVDGRRAYARVRAGETVVLRPRTVTVSAFTLRRPAAHRGHTDRMDLDVTRRVLLRHLRPGAGPRPRAPALGVGGHLTALRRTRVGPFTLDARPHAGAARRRAGAVARAGRRGGGHPAPARGRRGDGTCAQPRQTAAAGRAARRLRCVRPERARRRAGHRARRAARPVVVFERPGPEADRDHRIGSRSC